MLRNHKLAGVLATVALGVVLPLVLVPRENRSHGERGVAVLPPATTGEVRAELMGPRHADTRGEVEGEVPARSGFYAAPSGTALRFAVDSRQSTELALTGELATSTDFGVEARGELLLEILDRRAGEILAAVSYPVLEVGLRPAGVLDEAASDEMERELAQRAHVKLREDGACIGWSFPAGMSAGAQSMETGLLAQARFVVGADAPDAWTGEERDSAGTYVVEYQRLADEGASVELGRRRRELVPAANELGAGARTTLSDRSRARFDRTVGWMSSADCSERIELELGKEVRATASSTTTWRLIAHERSLAAPANAPWDLAWAVGVSQEALAVDSEEQQRRLDLAAIEGLSLATVVYDLDRIIVTDGLQSYALFKARELLKAYLRQHPDELERFAAFLSDGSMSEDAVGVALSALGALGTPTGQAFLAGVLADPARTEKTRVLSMLALFQVRQPTSEARTAIEAQWLDGDAAEQVRSTALMLLGTYARDSSERCAALLAYEPRAREDRMLDSYVAALGNAHLYGEVERLRDEPDSTVRDAAAQILAAQ